MRYVLAYVLIPLTFIVQAQYKDIPSQGTDPTTTAQGSGQDKEGILDRVYFGGGGSIDANQNVFVLSMSPAIGYKITESFSAGLQLTYQHVNVRFSDLSLNNYGGGPFLRYLLAENLFAHTEYEYLSFEIPNSESRLDFNSLFLGLGYLLPLGDQAGLSIMGLYNVLYEDGANSPYPRPLVIRAGLVVGF